jgi:hypothetical protein
MTTVKKYAGAYNNVGGWIVPANILGAEDGLCAFKQLVGNDFAEIDVSSFGFAIPPTAIIDKFACNAKGVVDVISGTVFSASGGFGLSKPPFGTGGAFVNYKIFGSCVNTAYDFSNAVLGGTITPNDINTENFKAEVDFQTYGVSTIAQCFCDSYYLTVDYHLPAAPSGIEDGLYCVSQCGKPKFKPRRVAPFSPLSLGFRRKTC